MMSESSHSETQHIEFKSDSFSSIVSNKEKNFLRMQEDYDSCDDEMGMTVPDELDAVAYYGHYYIRQEVIDIINGQRGVDIVPENRADRILNSILETDEEKSVSHPK